MQHHESNLNVDVQEFYPRVQLNDSEVKHTEADNKKCDATANVADLEQSQQLQQNVPKTKTDVQKNNVNKTSHTTKSSMGRATKKDIIDGIKSMEQQNINLVASSKVQKASSAVNNTTDVEWNVIKKGKKVKVVKDSQNNVESIEDKKEIVAVTTQEEEVKVKEEEIKPILSQENIKKISPISAGSIANTAVKGKKSKSKNKKKKPHLMAKQDGFEIIEPEFGNNSTGKESEEIMNEMSEEETIVEEIEIEIPANESEDVVDEVVIEEKPLIVEENVVKDEVFEVQVQEIIKPVEQMPKAIIKDDDDDAIIDISDEEICRKTSIEIDFSIAQEIAKIEEPLEIKIEKEPSSVQEDEIFNDISFFNDHKNIAELERDLMENLKLLDDGIDIKSPIINPLYDFPITSAVQKWLHAKQNESFDSLFRVENFKKLSELYDECDDDESDISDSPIKSETTDSDYASDIQLKLNGSPASSNAKIDTKITSKCNNKVIVKESFCALM